MVAQCFVALLAGFSNIGLTLCFLSHELTVNPSIQKRLLKEVLETRDKLDGKSLSYEVIQTMTYMDMMVSESMRKWTQMPIIERLTNKPYKLKYNDGSHTQFNVGDVILISNNGLHMDLKWFPNPDKFDPERFSHKNKHNIVSGTYIPFGIGPRNCVASLFVLLEIKKHVFTICCAIIVWRFRLKHNIQLK